MTNDKFEELAERVATHMCGIHAMHHLYHDDEITENMLNGLLAIQVMQGVELNWGVKELTAVAKSVSDDLESLQSGGIDAVMFGNEGDRPYSLKASNSL